VQSKVLFSEEGEELIAKVSLATTPELTQPGIEIFQELLGQNQEAFYYTRTAKSLLNHWLLLKQYSLLADQTIQPIPKGEHIISFSDCEEQINDKELQDPTDEVTEHELAVADRKIKKEIRTLENELQKFQILVQVDSVTGISPPDFDTQTLAVLRGRLVRYLMRSREITLGRSTKDNNIDVDLTREGPAWKISRRQGLIKLRNNGDFYLANEGKRPFYIDGQPLLTGNKLKLNNNSVVEISGLRFIFLINQDLINNIRTDPPRAGI
jgi:microspherule protein 1